MIGLIDIGNSNILIGFSDGEKILESVRLKTIKDKTADEYYYILKPVFDSYSVTDCIISSVVPVITSCFTKLLNRYFNINPMILGQGIKTGIQLKVDDPKTVGADIICDVAGAMNKFSEAIIVDLGTATKYIYCKDKTFLGLSISPGVAISMKALVENAALLPNIELVKPIKVIGTNTINCMQSGLVYGFASQVDGMIDRICEEINKTNIPVVATGGLSSIIIPNCKHDIELDQNLTIEGLLYIYKKNIEVK